MYRSALKVVSAWIDRMFVRRITISPPAGRRASQTDFAETPALSMSAVFLDIASGSAVRQTDRRSAVAAVSTFPSTHAGGRLATIDRLNFHGRSGSRSLFAGLSPV